MKLKKNTNCKALFCRYLLELYGDATQTMYLSANYKNFENDPSQSGVVTTSLTAMPSSPCNVNDPFPSLVFGGDDYNAFVQHVD